MGIYMYYLKGKSGNRKIKIDGEKQTLGCMNYCGKQKYGSSISERQADAGYSNNDVKLVWLKMGDTPIEGEPIFRRSNDNIIYYDCDADLKHIGWYEKGNLITVKEYESRGSIGGQDFDRHVTDLSDPTKKKETYYLDGEVVHEYEYKYKVD